MLAALAVGWRGRPPTFLFTSCTLTPPAGWLSHSRFALTCGNSETCFKAKLFVALCGRCRVCRPLQSSSFRCRPVGCWFFFSVNVSVFYFSSDVLWFHWAAKWFHFSRELNLRDLTGSLLPPSSSASDPGLHTNTLINTLLLPSLIPTDRLWVFECVCVCVTPSSRHSVAIAISRPVNAWMWNFDVIQIKDHNGGFYMAEPDFQRAF